MVILDLIEAVLSFGGISGMLSRAEHSVSTSYSYNFVVLIVIVEAHTAIQHSTSTRSFVLHLHISCWVIV